MTNTNVVPNDTSATGTPLSYSDAAAQALKSLDAIISLVPVSPVRQNTAIP